MMMVIYQNTFKKKNHLKKMQYKMELFIQVYHIFLFYLRSMNYYLLHTLKSFHFLCDFAHLNQMEDYFDLFDVMNETYIFN